MYDWELNVAGQTSIRTPMILRMMCHPCCVGWAPAQLLLVQTTT